MTKVLFVSLGNICRSPMAEGLFKQAIAERQLPWQIDSAATSSWEAGNPPHQGTRQLLADAGISWQNMVPGEGEDIPDPYYTGDFNQTYRLIQAGLPLWIEKIKNAAQ